MSNPGAPACLYLPHLPHYYPPENGNNVIPQTARHLYLPLVYETDLLPSAQQFGHFKLKSERARLNQMGQQLIGYLTKHVNLHQDHYGCYGCQMDGKRFPRATSHLIQFKNDEGETLGVIGKYTFAESKTEDADLADVEDGPKKTAEIAKRKQGRNPDHMLKHLIEMKLKAEEKKTALPWFMGIGIDKYVTEFASRIRTIHFIDDAREGTLTDTRNPANLFNLFNLRSALAILKEAGAAAAYLDEKAYEYHRFPGPAQGTIRVQPDILDPACFGSYLLPHFPRPRIDLAEPENAHQVRVAFEELKMRNEDQFIGRQEEEKQQLLQRLQFEAEDVVRARIASKQVAEATTGSRDQLRQAVKKLLDKARADAHKLLVDETEEINDRYKRTAAAVLEAKKEALVLYRIFIQQDTALNKASVLIREWGSEFLATHKNFCLPRKRMFQNLTLFGEMVALALLAEETALETNVLHAISFLFRTAIMHVYFEMDMHPNPMLLGRAMGGKSHMFKTYMKQLIPGTAIFLQGQSEKAMMTQDTFMTGDMIMLEEEFMPSTLGIEGNSKKHNAAYDNPNTDKSSRFRASATSQEIGYQRLTKNPTTGSYELEVIDKKLNRIVGGAMNIALHQLPENIRSRLFAILVAPKTREGQSLLERASNPAPQQYKHVLKLLETQIRVDQFLMYHVAKLMDLGILEMDQTAARAFVTEVFRMANERGITGLAQDVRELNRIYSLVQVHAAKEAIHRVFHAEDSPLKDQPFDMEHLLLHLEPVLTAKVEHAAHVLEQMADQFSPPFAADILRAINNTFSENNPYYKPPQRHRPEVKNTTADESDADDDNEDEEIEAQKKKAAHGNRQLKQTTMESHLEAKEIADYYVDIEVKTGPINAAFLYRKIEGQMLNRPPADTGEHFLTSLTSTEIRVGRGTIPALVFDDINRKIRIAKEILKKPTKNQFCNVILQALCAPHMPLQTFVRGSTPHDAPWKWRLFANDEDLVDPADEAALKRLRRLQKRARKEASDEVVLYNPAHQEQVMWDIVQGIPSHLDPENALKYYEEQMERKSFMRYLNCAQGVKIQDMDQEDFRHFEFLLHKVFLDEKRAALSMWVKGEETFPRAIQLRELADVTAAMNRFLEPVRSKPPSKARDQALLELRKKWQYPDCFESRNPKEYKKLAIQAAKENPQHSRVSVQCKKWNDLAGFGYRFRGEGKEEKQESKYPRRVALDKKDKSSNSNANNNRSSSSKDKSSSMRDESSNSSSSMQDDMDTSTEHKQQELDLFGDPGWDEAAAAVLAEQEAEAAAQGQDLFPPDPHDATEQALFPHDTAADATAPQSLFPHDAADKAAQETKVMMDSMMEQSSNNSSNQKQQKKRAREQEEVPEGLPQFDLFRQLQMPKSNSRNNKKQKVTNNSKPSAEDRALEAEVKGLQGEVLAGKRKKKPVPGSSNVDGLGMPTTGEGEDDSEDDDYVELDPEQAAEEAELDDRINSSDDMDDEEEDSGGVEDDPGLTFDEMDEGQNLDEDEIAAAVEEINNPDAVDAATESGEATAAEIAAEERESKRIAKEEEAEERRLRKEAAAEAKRKGFASLAAQEAAEDMEEDTAAAMEDETADDE